MTTITTNTFGRTTTISPPTPKRPWWTPECGYVPEQEYQYVGDCKPRYIYCRYNTVKTQPCPYKNVYDKKNATCYPEEWSDCEADAPITHSVEAEPKIKRFNEPGDCQWIPNGQTQFKEQCGRHFIRCVDGKVREEECPSFRYFDPIRYECRHPHAIEACAGTENLLGFNMGWKAREDARARQYTYSVRSLMEEGLEPEPWNYWRL